MIDTSISTMTWKKLLMGKSFLYVKVKVILTNY